MSTSDGFALCALCPRLCRPACPVAVGTGREAATPTAIAGVLLDWQRGLVSDEHAAHAAALCTHCGGCQDHCHLHRPLPDLLIEAGRALLTPPAPHALQPVEGSQGPIVVEPDERPLAAALTTLTGLPHRAWKTDDYLGAASVYGPGWSQHCVALGSHAGQAAVIVADGGSARALEAAGVKYRWLADVFDADLPLVSSCVCGGEQQRPLQCCGATGPLPQEHPEDAALVARGFARRLTDGAVLADARCRGHLQRAGAPARDLIDLVTQDAATHGTSSAE